MKCSFQRFAASVAVFIALSTAGVFGAEAPVETAPLPPSAPIETALSTSAPVPPPPPPETAPPAPLAPALPATSAGVNGCAPLGHAMEGCGAACGTCESSGYHIVTTAEAVWLAPCENQREGSFTIYNGLNSVEQFSGARATDEGLIATPRIMLGIQGDCWGAQIRYWRMEETSNLNGNDLLTGVGSVTSSGFFAETLDLEATRLVCVGDSPAQFTFGVRYAQLNQSVDLFANDVVAGDFYSGSARSDLNFSGVGLTSSFWGLKPIECSNFNLFYSVRGSVLWDGNASGFAETRADYQSVLNGWAKDYHAARAGGDSNMFIGEVQLGGQWNFALKCIPANAFLRFAFEYQYWAVNDAGYAQAQSFAGGPSLVGVATAHSGDAFVNLVGFNVGTGITW